jgi:hypothetical protein
MEQVDRTALKFTPVTTNARITLELSSHVSYDAMLHVYDRTSRTIAFRKTPSGYRWIGLEPTTGESRKVTLPSCAAGSLRDRREIRC